MPAGDLVELLFEQIAELTIAQLEQQFCEKRPALFTDRRIVQRGSDDYAGSPIAPGLVTFQTSPHCPQR
jgi:hypothetical protein